MFWLACDFLDVTVGQNHQHILGLRVHRIPVLSPQRADFITQSIADIKNRADITYPCLMPGITLKHASDEQTIEQLNYR